MEASYWSALQTLFWLASAMLAGLSYAGVFLLGVVAAGRRKTAHAVRRACRTARLACVVLVRYYRGVRSERATAPESSR